MADPSNINFSRRKFLGAASVAATSSAYWTAESYAKIVGTNDRIRVGFIGAGGMGNSHLSAFINLKEKNNLEAVGVADCWTTRAEAGAKKIGAPNLFSDYRKLLEIKEIDYVTIATPEHRHAEMTLDALDAGKAVYCEKPLTHTAAEALAVMKKQAETKLPLQVGVQGMSDDSYISARKAIDQGVIGQVVHAQIEYVRRYDTQGLFRTKPATKDDLPKPADLDWNAWLGSAPQTPWNPHHYHEWRCYSCYSGGIATDLFIHRLTRIMKALGLLYPRS